MSVRGTFQTPGSLSASYATRHGPSVNTPAALVPAQFPAAAPLAPPALLLRM